MLVAIAMLWACTESEPRARQTPLPPSDDSSSDTDRPVGTDTAPPWQPGDTTSDDGTETPPPIDTQPITSPECENEGERYCNFTCMLPNTSDHCGACNTRCSAGTVCIEVGPLQWDCGCADGAVRCGGKCVDPMTDAAFCGASGTCTGLEAGANCGVLGACVDGLCQCIETHTNCGGQCVDTLTHRDYCNPTPGSCGVSCMAGGVCVDGHCACPADRSLECSTGCVNPQNDDNACGGCPEDGGEVCDTANGFSCIDGSCQCPANTALCDGQCVDTRSSNDHCGGCYNDGAGPGIRCDNSQGCFAGQCVDSPCDPLVMGNVCSGAPVRTKSACETSDDHFQAGGIKCDNNNNQIPKGDTLCFDIRDVASYKEFRCWWSGRSLTVNGQVMSCNNNGDNILPLPPSVGGHYCVYFPPSNQDGAGTDGFSMGNR